MDCCGYRRRSERLDQCQNSNNYIDFVSLIIFLKTRKLVLQRISGVVDMVGTSRNLRVI